jgi:murein DD-endopeptidase MepM/ murein hydrolase activator NlpD
MSIYCNLADVQVEAGQQIVAGAQLAKIAMPAPGGRAHLHFELRDADGHIDPMTLLPKAG